MVSLSHQCDGTHKAKKTTNPSWRLEPVESQSDWTIIVTSNELDDGEYNVVKMGKVKTYYVHKSQLGEGERHSGYFASLFRNTSMVEAINSTSTISLSPSGADAFPHMLDFIYYSSIDSIDIHNALPLRQLSSYFDIPSLLEKVRGIIKCDLKNCSVSTAITYLIEATGYRDEEVVHDAVDAIMTSSKEYGDGFGILEQHAETLISLPPDLFQMIMAAVAVSAASCCVEGKNVSDERRSVPSAIIAKYCRAHPTIVEEEMGFWEEITSVDMMPYIDPHEALFFLNLDKDRDTGGGDQDKNKLNDRDKDKGLSVMSLRTRCLEAAVSNWKKSLIGSEEGKDHDDNSCIATPSALTKQQEIKKKRDDYDDLLIDTKVGLLENALQAAAKEIETLKLKLDEQIIENIEYKDKFDNEKLKNMQLNERIKKESLKSNDFINELSKFERFPLSSFMSLSSKTVESNIRFLEQDRPSVMPKFPSGAPCFSQKGAVFKVGQKRCPVFYYNGTPDDMREDCTIS